MTIKKWRIANKTFIRHRLLFVIYTEPKNEEIFGSFLQATENVLPPPTNPNMAQKKKKQRKEVSEKQKDIRSFLNNGTMKKDDANKSKDEDLNSHLLTLTEQMS